MRWIAIALILLSLPVFIAWLGKREDRRDHALIAIGVMVFCSGALKIDASPISWPMWGGTAKGITISPVDTMALALLATRKRLPAGLPFWPLLAFYLVPMVFSIAFAGAPMASTFPVFQLFRMAILFAAVGGELERPGAFRKLLIGLSIGLIIQAGFVIYQKLTGVVQASGTHGHQNILGLMVEMAALPIFAAILAGERNKIVYLGILAALITVAGGGSRASTALLAAGLALVLLVSLIRKPSPRKFQILGIGVLAGALFAALALASLKDRFGDTSMVTEEEQRAAFERAASAMASDHPFGVGANQYVTVANTQGYAEAAGVAWNQANRAAPVHNSYLLARAETGWAGQLALIALILVPAVAGFSFAFRNRKNPSGELALGCAIALFVVSAHLNYEYAWHMYHPQAIFFLNLAMIAGIIRATRLERKAEQRKRKERNGPPGTVPALGARSTR